MISFAIPALLGPHSPPVTCQSLKSLFLELLLWDRAWHIVMLPVRLLNRLKVKVPEVAKSKWFSRTVICTLISFALLSGNWNHYFKQSEGQRQLKSCSSRETKGMSKDPGVKIFQNNLPFFIFFCSCFKWNGKYLIFFKKKQNKTENSNK